MTKAERSVSKQGHFQSRCLSKARLPRRQGRPQRFSRFADVSNEDLETFLDESIFKKTEKKCAVMRV